MAEVAELNQNVDESVESLQQLSGVLDPMKASLLTTAAVITIIRTCVAEQ
jgi:hypothetical protein